MTYIKDADGIIVIKNHAVRYSKALDRDRQESIN